MAEGRERAQWWHTASMIATAINTAANRNPKAPPIEPKAIYPDFDGADRAELVEDIDCMERVFRMIVAGTDE